jgi:methyl-accepting chemotaxis protein
MSNKTLLIVERSEAKLHSLNEEEKYVLEGTFTEVGVKNNNNRIYDEKELVPHINELKKMCEGNRLLGELDHPKSFDISLQNASHIIESIDYDKDKKVVTGRIRLLNTDAGRNARALVDAGVPLHISSRAAGVVENNGHVKIKKMFTYDLVANPGFTNAQLKRVNESYGFDDFDNIGLFEIPESWDTFKESIDNYELENPKINKINEMDTNKYISIEDFNQYTKLVKNEFENLKKIVKESSSADETYDNKGIVKYAEAIAKKVNTLQESIAAIHENIEGLTAHNDYIIENLTKVKDYAELVGERSNIGINYTEKLAESVDHLIEYTRYVAENTDNGITYTEKLAESTDFLIEYTKMVAEKSDQGIEYTKHVAEKADQGIEYTKMVAEKADQGIEYTKMIAEKTNQVINHVDYVVEESSNRWKYQTHMNEQLDNVISHNDYIVEGHDSIIKYTEHLREQSENLKNYVNFVVESINESNGLLDVKDTINKSLNIDKEDDFKKNISSQLNSILESTDNTTVNNPSKDLHFLTFMDSSKRNEFEALNESAKDKVIEAFKSNRYYGSADALRIWESCFQTVAVKKDWLTDMPEKYKTSWNSLNESQKNAIKAQASTRLLNTQYQIDNFWDTRDLREVIVKVNESTNTVITDSSTYETPTGYMDAVRNGLRNRFKR